LIKDYSDLLAYNIQQQEVFSNICKPLFEHLPISHFFYGRYYLNGRYFVLGNRPKFLKFYFDHNLTKPNEIFLEDFVYIPSQGVHKYLWPLESTVLSSTMNVLKEMGIRNGLNVTINRGDFFETFIFSSSVGIQQAHNLYLNSFDLLQRFMTYFHQQARTLVTGEEIKSFPYSALYENKMREASLENSQKTSRMKLIEQTILSQHPIMILGKEFSISTREFDCMTHLSKGKSIKEIASILELSPHTITSHIGNIKIKLGVISKSKLIDYFLESSPASPNYKDDENNF